jgi:DNA primase
MTSNDLDFADIKNQARFEAVLANYGLETTGQAAERMTKCPFHDDRSPSCSLNLDKKVFHCFACGEKGTILDFVARMESCSITEAARLLAEWCNIAGSLSAVASESEVRIKRSAGNQPLKFALQLDPRHRYLAARGVSEGTVSRFGLGYCDRGIMKGRICIPLHDDIGRLAAYAGRWARPTAPTGEPRYKFPRGFRKNLVLFNFHRVASAHHLVVVEGFWSVFRLDALGIAAVALMGCTLSAEQEEILRISPADRITLLLDGDGAGRQATSEILPRLARHCFVQAPDLPAGAEPDTMDEKSLMEAIQAVARK